MHLTEKYPMSASTTLTIRLTQEAKDQLGRLANTTHRIKSVLAAEAITHYLARESAIIESIGRGLADMQAGRLVPHAEAMDRLEATIVAVERGKR